MPTNDLPEPEPSGRTWPGRQVKKHPFIALGVAIVASLAIGWVAGSKITCGPECNADADMIGAIGTWVGGVATAFAFALTARELVITRRRQENEARWQARKILAKARTVNLLLPTQDITKTQGEGPTLNLVIDNPLDSPIVDVRGRIGHNGQIIFEKKEVPGKKENIKPSNNELLIPLREFSEEPIYSSTEKIATLESDYEAVWGENGGTVSGKEAGKITKLLNEIIKLKNALEEPLKEIMKVEFTLEDHTFHWHKGKVTLTGTPTP